MNTQAMLCLEVNLPDQLFLSPGKPKCVGIATDHGGYALMEYLVSMLRKAGADVIDFGDRQAVPDDDYPDFVVPLARAVAAGRVDRGVAICGSGVGASVVANKVAELEARQPSRKVIRTIIPKAERDLALASATRESTNSGQIKPLRLYLIRHGETQWSLSGRYTGSTDIGLTAQGEDEARDVGQRLRGIAFAHVLTSPLQRAQQTCTLAALEGTPEIEPDLAEWDNGDDEGRTPADILASRSEWNLFWDGSPNGESPEQIRARADRLIVRLRALDGNVALFSHGHFGRVLAARWIGLCVGQAQPFLLNTASVSILCYAHGHPNQPAIELWNAPPSHAPFNPTPEPYSDTDKMTEEESLEQWDNEGGMTPDEQLTST